MATEQQLKEGDTVKIVGLKSKSHWNDKFATIIGPFLSQKQRWPIQINFGDRSKALLQTKNLKASSIDSTKSEHINVVEIQSNRGRGIGPLVNALRNSSFTKPKLWKRIKTRRLKEYKSPFSQLLGYDLSIFVDPNTSDHELNAGAVFLTCALHNGLSPHLQLRGNCLVFSNDPHKMITSDRLWGILNFIFECMDYYDGTIEMSADERNKQIMLDVRNYKEGKWCPRGGTGGINLYNDDVNSCKLNQF